MTLKIKMLTAAAALAIPAVAGAQLVPTTPPEAITQQPDSASEAARETQEATESAPGTVDETVREVDETPSQPVPSQPPMTQPVPQQTTPPGQTPPPEAQTPPVEAQTQATTQATTQSSTSTQTQPTPAQQPTTQTQAQTSAPAHANVQAGPVSAATATDLRAGVMVHDAAGGMVGTVVSADADSAVVSTGTIRAEIPLRSFGKNNLGLVISMTRAQLEAAAQSPSPS